MYIYETHCHTSETSKCGISDGASYARYFKKLGYSGFFITDHFWGSNIVDMPEDWSWRQKVDRFALGYENAKAEGERLGINVMFGWEYGVGITHFVTYGFDKYWLYENPDIVGLGLVEYAEKIHKSGGIVVHAHPFRDDDSLISFMPAHTDAVEVINGARGNNERANAYADMIGLPKTAGSDIHNINTERMLAGVISGKELKTPRDYIDELLADRLHIFQTKNKGLF